MYKTEQTTGWTLSLHRSASVAYVENQKEILHVLTDARQRKLTVTLRGAGFSYADEILNQDGIILDLSRMNRILEWDPTKGLLNVEPGVTFEQALQRCLPDLWIVPAVPGIKKPTLGGALSNNVHGKNSWKDGNLGDAIVSFSLMTGDGRVHHCSRQENADLFQAAIGGLGLLGVFLEFTLQCKKIPSPYLAVHKSSVPNLSQMLKEFEELRKTATFHIGWVDCFVRGKDFGRGTIHSAEFIERPPHHSPTTDLPRISPNIFGVFPRSLLWPVIKPFFGNTLMRWTNAAKYYRDKATAGPKPVIQNFYEFNFLLDLIPDWRQLFTPHGYFELEPIIPFGSCEKAFHDLIRLTQEYGTPSHLTAIKSHRKDDYSLTYSMDGCSIGIDIPNNPRKSREIEKLFLDMNEVVVNAGGRDYLAKDEKLTAVHFQHMYPAWSLFQDLKRRYDPDMLFQSDMYRRLFAGARSQS